MIHTSNANAFTVAKEVFVESKSLLECLRDQLQSLMKWINGLEEKSSLSDLLCDFTQNSLKQHNFII